MTTITTYRPSLLGRNVFDEIFDSMLDFPALMQRTTSGYPVADIYREKNGNTVMEFALAGFKKEELTVEIKPETKSITVSEKPEIEIKDTNEETKPIDFIKNAEILIDKNEFKSSEKFYSPLVKNISKKEGVSIEELNSISGTGKNGRVTKNDLLNYISSKSKPSNYSKDTTEHSGLDNHSDEIIEMSRMEKLISDHMLMSKQKSAHVQAFIEVDISELWNWREKIKDSFFQRENQKITFTPIFIYIVAQVSILLLVAEE